MPKRSGEAPAVRSSVPWKGLSPRRGLHMNRTSVSRQGTRARRLATALAGVAVVAGIAAAPGMAATKSLTVAGIKRPVKDLAAMKGHVMVASPKKDVLVGFTDKSAFRAYVKNHLHVNLSAEKLKPVAGKKVTAKASWSGHHATFSQPYSGHGAAFNISPGPEEAHRGRVGCSLGFYKNYNNML